MLRRELRFRCAEGNQPLSAHSYFDRLQLWLKNPINKSEREFLNANCGKGGAHIDVTRRARWSHEYRTRLDLKQPNEQVLRWISNLPDALLNQVEVALDTVWPGEREADAAFWFFHRHLIRRYHGKTQKVRFYGDVPTATVGTFYDGQRKHPNRLAVYRPLYDRFTGEYCPLLHLEWRANGVEALRQAGLPGQLLGFDHYAFWSKRLLLVDVEPEKLGRYLRNRTLGRRARQPEFQEVRNLKVNLHRRFGHVLLSNYDRLQELIDAYRRQRISRIFDKLDNRRFLAPLASYAEDADLGSCRWEKDYEGDGARELRAR